MARRKIQVKSKKSKVKSQKAAKLSKETGTKVKKEELLEISQEWNKLHNIEKQESASTKVMADKKKEMPKRKPDDSRTQDDKRLLMWAGVSFFMVLILFFWVLNMKNVFKPDIDNNSAEEENNWSEITNEFSETMEEIKTGLSEFKDQAAEAPKIENTAEGERGVLPSADAIPKEEDEIKILKERLEELEKKMETE